MYIPLYLIQQQTRNIYKKKKHSLKGPVTKDRQETPTLNQIRLLLQKQGFASYTWNMSKAVAKKLKTKKPKKPTKIPALKEYIHGNNLLNSQVHI